MKHFPNLQFMSSSVQRTFYKELIVFYGNFSPGRQKAPYFKQFFDHWGTFPQVITAGCSQLLH